MVPHEREECGWAVVECSYQCGAHLPRRLMDEHQHDKCQQQPRKVKIENFITKEQHEKEMRKIEARLTAMESRLVTEREQHKREMTELKVTITTTTHHVVMR